MRLINGCLWQQHVHVVLATTWQSGCQWRASDVGEIGTCLPFVAYGLELQIQLPGSWFRCRGAQR
jgi:hypothetical protein